jgi:nucleoside diphosphate kinase
MERPFAFMMIKPLGTKEPVKSEVLGMVRQIADITVRKRVVVAKADIEDHYRDIRGTPHFSPITRYLTGKRVEILIAEGDGNPDRFIAQMRQLVGNSDPAKCHRGQIRHLAIEHNLRYIIPMRVVNGSNNYCRDNLIHCSDSPSNAVREVGIWFDDLDVLWRYTCMPKSRSSIRC